MAPVLQPPPERFEEFRVFLAERGFTFEPRAHQLFLARKGKTVENLYDSWKVVFGGSDTKQIEEVAAHATILGALPIEKKVVALPPLDVPFPHIGTDEVGKGDYFGPLVTAGVLATTEDAHQLERIGVKDSKLLSDTTVANKASQLRNVCGPKRYRIVIGTTWVSCSYRAKRVGRLAGAATLVRSHSHTITALGRDQFLVETCREISSRPIQKLPKQRRLSSRLRPVESGER